MPFYSSSALLRWRARGILSFVLEAGSFGHNRDMSYFKRNPYLVRKVFSFWWRSWDIFRQMLIFPVDSVRVWGGTIVKGVEAVREVREGVKGCYVTMQMGNCLIFILK